MTARVLYESLDPARQQFRLLHLLPANKREKSKPWYSAERIRCRMTLESMAHHPEYEALSYEWGQEAPIVTITINNQKFLVRQNLAFALAALRRHNTRVLWVDALCINQNDIDERNSQVRQMADIYREAQCVVVWLGRDSCLAHDVVYILERLGNHSPALNFPGQPGSSPGYSGLDVQKLQDWITYLLNHLEIAALTPQKQVARIKQMAETKVEVHELEEGHFLEKLALCLDLHDSGQLEKAAEHQRDLVDSWVKLSRSKEESWNETVFGMAPYGILGSIDTNRYTGVLRIGSMCNLSYWHRLWIVQEVLLARDILVAFGDHKNTVMKWDCITKAQTCLDKISRQWSTKDREFRIMENSMMWYLARLRQPPRTHISPTSLFAFTKRSLCQDPRDKIYGLLGILDPGLTPSITIDYSIPLTTLYLELIRWFKHKFDTSTHTREFLEFGRAVRSTWMQAKNRGAALGISQHDLDEAAIHGCTDEFHVVGMLGGSVLFTEEISNTSSLKDLAEWIHTLSLSSSFSKIQIEEKIRDLVAIKTTWRTPFSPRGHAHRQSTPEYSPLKANDQSQRMIAQAIFVTENGEIGIGSSAIQNRDILCWFPGFAYGLVMRMHEADNFTLVSKATTSPQVLKAEMEMREFVDLDALTTEVLGTRREDPLACEEGEIFDIILDMPAYHDLVCPVEFAQVEETWVSMRPIRIGGKRKFEFVIGDGGPQSITREPAESTRKGESSKTARYVSLSFEDLLEREISFEKDQKT